MNKNKSLDFLLRITLPTYRKWVAWNWGIFETRVIYNLQKRNWFYFIRKVGLKSHNKEKKKVTFFIKIKVKNFHPFY